MIELTFSTVFFNWFTKKKCLTILTKNERKMDILIIPTADFWSNAISQQCNLLERYEREINWETEESEKVIYDFVKLALMY